MKYLYIYALPLWGILLMMTNVCLADDHNRHEWVFSLENRDAKFGKLVSEITTDVFFSQFTSLLEATNEIEENLKDNGIKFVRFELFTGSPYYKVYYFYERSGDFICGNYDIKNLSINSLSESQYLTVSNLLWWIKADHKMVVWDDQRSDPPTVLLVSLFDEDQNFYAVVPDINILNGLGISQASKWNVDQVDIQKLWLLGQLFEFLRFSEVSEQPATWFPNFPPPKYPDR